MDIRLGKVDGLTERKCCLRMLAGVKHRLGIEPATLRTDEGRDTQDFVKVPEDRRIELHAACNSTYELDVLRETDDDAGARWFNQRLMDERPFKLSHRK